MNEEAREKNSTGGDKQRFLAELERLHLKGDRNDAIADKLNSTSLVVARNLREIKNAGSWPPPGTAADCGQPQS
jgi:hypothetical protein